MRHTKINIANNLTNLKILRLSKNAKQKLKWFDYYNCHGENARLTCRYFGISPQTFYRWKRRYNPENLGTLENQSHRPKRLRQAIASEEMINVIKVTREKHPDWGKVRLNSWLRANENFHVSDSTIGRILTRLKEQGIFHEPIKTKKVFERQKSVNIFKKKQTPYYSWELVQMD